MMNSITKDKLYLLVRGAAVALFWISLWEILALSIDNSFLLPSVGDTLRELKILLSDISSYKVMLFTLARVIAGLFLGVLFGSALGILCHYSVILRTIFSPFMTIVKSTPVASFIVVLWVIMSGDALSVFIALLMVMPIVYQNVTDAYFSIDKNLAELCDVFGFSFKKRFKLLISPALLSYLVPAVITSLGLGWKAEIAAEIIAYTKNSIGQRINDGKFAMNTPRVFAWTVIIIVFSLILEKIAKMLLGRFRRNA